MNKFPPDIEKLIKQREKARNAKEFDKADKIRDELESYGYSVTDMPNGQHIETKKSRKPAKSFIALFGSGEISSVGRKIHEYVLKQMQIDAPNIVIISTPAGFQPNVRTVKEEIKDFFLEHLTNFHPQVKILYANTRDEANDSALVSPIETADYIFIGPGSPTYVVNHLKDTLLLEKIIERVENGASLSLSSAAVLGFSHFTLPVYEIYKVGTPLHWKEGLDLYSSYIAQNLTVVPHFNNSEGGKKTDTSFCFMGVDRFETLKNMLPDSENIWGIDENTALIYDIKSKTEKIMGLGGIKKLTDA